MKKHIIPLLCVAATTPALAQQQSAVVPEGEGKIFNQDHVTLVRKTFTPDAPMKRHNHPGAEIILTVIKGNATFTINDDEKHDLRSGDVLIFNGDNDISGEFAEETLITVTLIENDGHGHKH